MTQEEPKQILRRSLHDELLARLRKAIVDGDYDQGEKLSESDLCARFGVSRTPLREAVKVLAIEGLVRLTPNRGANIASITSQDIADLFPIMGALEALGGELAATRVTQEQLVAIKSAHATMMSHYKAGETDLYLKVNEEIHIAIMEAAQNAPLMIKWQNLMVRIMRVRFRAKMSATHWKKAIDDHEAMIAALETRDPVALSRILKQHVNLKADTVRQALLDAENARKPSL